VQDPGDVVASRRWRVAGWVAFIGVAVAAVVSARFLAGLSAAVLVLTLAGVAGLLFGVRAFRWAPLVFGLLGGVVAAPSAVQALLLVGRDPAYAPRAGLGWAALALALVASLAAVAMRGHPRLLALVTILAALGGGVAINLFYINTFYVVALPLWLVGAAVAAFSPGSSRGQHLV